MKKWGVVLIGFLLIATLVYAASTENRDNMKYTGTHDLDKKNSVTAAITDGLTLKQQTTGTPAAGIGVGIAVQVEDAGGLEEQGSIDFVATTVTDGAEDFDFVVNQNDNGTIRETLRIIADNDGTTEGTRMQFTSTSAETNGVNDLLVLKASGGTTVAGFGAGIDLQAEFADGVETACKMEAVWTDVSTGTEDADFVVNCKDAGTIDEVLRVTSDGIISVVGAVPAVDFAPTTVAALPACAGGTAGTTAYITFETSLCFCNGTNYVRTDDGTTCTDS